MNCLFTFIVNNWQLQAIFGMLSKSKSVAYYGREHLVSFYQCYIQILVLGAQGIRATGFKRAQGNAHCAKFESHTNRVTFETNAIRMTPSVQALQYYM